MTIERLWLRSGVLCLLLVTSACSVRQSKESTGKGEGAEAKADGNLLEEGRTAFRKCATCHCATDPAIAEDEDWLKMNETTACISGGKSTPRMRQALNAYLRSDRAIRPLRIDEAYAPKEGLPHGSVILPEVAGSAFLKAEGDEVARGAPSKIRLYWKAGAKGRRFNIPAGAYRVISYALYSRGTDDAQRWMMTATDINGCLDVVVEAGNNVPLDLQPVFRGVLFSEPVEQGTMVRFKQTDRHGNVATLSVRGEPRVPEYVVLDRDGKKLHAAVFENT